MREPSEFARITADTLNTYACRQIVDFLRSSAKQDDLLSLTEVGVLNNAASSLEQVLQWQTPEK